MVTGIYYSITSHKAKVFMDFEAGTITWIECPKAPHRLNQTYELGKVSPENWRLDESSRVRLTLERYEV